MKYVVMLTLLIFQLMAESAYLLPHRWHDARHEINRVIRHADSMLIIVTDSLSDTQLQRALRHAIKEKQRVLLITTSIKTASHWAMYQTVSACMLSHNRPLGFSIVAAEKSDACYVSGTLESESFRNNYGILFCDDSSLFSQTIQLLRQECENYFNGTNR